MENFSVELGMKSISYQATLLYQQH